MGKCFASAINIDSIICGLQQLMVRATTTTHNPAAVLLDSYSKDSFHALFSERWPTESILTAIDTCPYKSALTKEAVHFFRNELLERTECGFSVILTKADALKYFGNYLQISRLVSINQTNRKPCLICNSTATPDTVTPSINVSFDDSSKPKAIQFISCLQHLFQKI